MKLAIMQPYFIPYAGYFRLMAEADLFIVYDCVQFPRRGWVHRNKISKANGEAEWLTLPLTKGDRNTTRIMDLRFMEKAQSEWEKRLKSFPLITENWNHTLIQHITQLKATPLDTIESSIKFICELLEIDCKFERSSHLNIPVTVKSQDRILTIAKHFGATEYFNAPGGTELYDEESFAQHGIKLKFLPEYSGSYASILERLLTNDSAKIRQEIVKNGGSRGI